MLREEFEQGTGFFPTLSLYKVIEKHYMDFAGDKVEFCNAYKKDANGLATKIQREADMQEINAQIEAEKPVEGYETRIAKLEKDLEREQEWQLYEMEGNIKQADYEKLAKGAETGEFSRYMTDLEAVAWVCDEFGFDSSKVTIIHEVDEYKINRHRQLRRTGRKIDRRPVYCATDYHYIRFNVSHWCYEAWSGRLRPFYD